MKGVILAAGIGSRLRPLTLYEPKCCVTVGETPVLARQLRAYADAGVTDVTVVAGYLADDTRALCEEVAAERPELDVTVTESEVYANTDNMYSLYLAREAVAGEEFVLSNGDAVFDPGLLADLVDDDAGSAIASDPRTYSEEAMKVTVDDRGRVSHIAKDVPEDVAHAISNDVYRFSASFSAKLFEDVTRTIERDGEYGGWTEAAIDRVVRNHEHDLKPVDVGEYRWVEIDDTADLQTADLLFSSLSDLGEKEAAFFDLDGTVYLDDDLVDDAKGVLSRLREAGVDVYFLTNNSSKWKDDYAAKLSNLDIPTDPGDVLLSTDGVIEHLREADAGKVYVLGTETMREAVAGHGIDVVDDPAAADAPDAVVVGFDTELTYEKARTATLAIRNGATFLLAHPDAVCPTAEGFVPDCGAIGAMIETATDQSPAHVFGKPNAEMVEHVLDSKGYDPADVFVVGDRLETDVRLAENVGCESVCVLTGDATRIAVEKSEVRPSMVAPSVGALAQLLDGEPTTGAVPENASEGDSESENVATAPEER
ncbi:MULTISPECIES: HAD-IIA family hydrolase [Halorussus]|uniref:HAD-IIA family hydrolase n=1 Tax=Halorussus TaxID=1070314 RepID=UPI0020A0F506|nr:HAD-IIA family hydrolase [Halorussus vallis]USZ76760.1 HAD-IIA family hydrolase [Halorussus vallis]